MAKLAFEVAVDDLLEAASKVNQIVPAKSLKPALMNIFLQSMDGVLEVHGTDLSVSATYKVPTAKIEAEGSLLINGALFVDLLKGCKGLTAKISATKNDHLSFCAPGANYTFAAGDPRDFPALPRLDTQPGYAVKGADLNDMIAKTEFAVSADQTRGLPTQGVCVELADGRLRFVATDTRRLSVAERSASYDPTLSFTATLPVQCVRLLQKVLAKDLTAGEVTIGFIASQVFIRGAAFVVSGRALNGKYPPYQDALTVSLDKSVDFDRSELRTLLKRACLVDETAASFRFEPGKLTLASSSRMVGVSAVDLPVNYTGPKTSIGFNPRFIEDGLAVMKSSRCRLSFEHHLKAGLLRELVDDGTGNFKENATYLYLVMPQHVGSDVEGAEA